MKWNGTRRRIRKPPKRKWKNKLFLDVFFPYLFGVRRMWNQWIRNLCKFMGKKRQYSRGRHIFYFTMTSTLCRTKSSSRFFWGRKNRINKIHQITCGYVVYKWNIYTHGGLCKFMIDSFLSFQTISTDRWLRTMLLMTVLHTHALPSLTVILKLFPWSCRRRQQRRSQRW